MDNVTHSLVGLLLAEVILEARGPQRERPDVRLATCFTSILANNAPDLDILYTGITEGKFGYLLHHRGHTHTLAALPLVAAFSFGMGLGVLRLARKFSRQSGTAAERETLWMMALTAALGPAVHLLLDFCNSYGVHPFWPLNNAWYFGDSLFIIEPWILVLLPMALFWSQRTRGARLALGLIAGAFVAASFAAWSIVGVVAVAVAVGGGVTLLGLRRASHRTRIGVALCSLISVIAVYASVGAHMRAKTRAMLRETSPEEQHVALVGLPTPGSPVCWSFFAIQERGPLYVVKSLRASLLPSLVPAETCHLWLTAGTAPRVAAAMVAPDNAEFVWDGEFRGPRAELAELAQNNCYAQAFLRFARVPFWLSPSGSTAQYGAFIMGDLRFDREEGLGFGEIDVPAHPERCPAFVPDWGVTVAPVFAP